MKTKTRIAVAFLLFFCLFFSACSVDPRGDGKGVDLYDEVTLIQQVFFRLRIGDLRGVVRAFREHLQGEDMRVQRRIARLYNTGDDEGVIQFSTRYFEKCPLSGENISALLFKAASHQRLNQVDKAIESYKEAVPFIKKMNNVEQRRYADVFFTLGYLYGDQGEHETAIAYIHDGLVVEPQNIYFQIYLGELYKASGQTKVALDHYKELLDSSPTLEEEKVVLKIKIRQLDPRALPADFKPVDMRGRPFYKGFTLKILPINQHDSIVNLEDLCTFLESKFLFACEVLEPVELDEAKVLDEERDQYDGDKILNELAKYHPASQDRRYLLLAITGKDIFGENTNYVYSWQNRNLGIGVVSSFRFLAGLDEFYEREIVITRRLGIQFISTTGFLLGFTRPTKPHCPDAFPTDFYEFLQKSSRLCSSTIEQRNALLEEFKKFGVHPTSFSLKQNVDINRVYKKYYFKFESV